MMLKMLKSAVLLILALLSVAGLISGKSEGFASRFGPDGDCARCHVLSAEEANSIIRALNPEIKVLGVSMGPVDGVWEVVIEARGKKGIAYVDFSKEHIITGSVIKLSTRENLTNLKLYDLSKVDTSIIPLEEALVLGNKDAKYKAIVFDDPDWPYCKKLHLEMKKIVKERDDIVFYIKMYPLRSHPAAYKKSKAIVCAKSLKLLEDAFAGQQLPEPSCETTEVDDNIKLAESLGITGTPAIILQDGAIVPGYKDAETLVRAIESSVAEEESPGEPEESATAPEEEEGEEEEAPEPERHEERTMPWY